MQAIILAAGEGKRLRPLTLEIPKPLLKIKDMPILEYTLRNLPEKVREVILVVGYKEEEFLAPMIGTFAKKYPVKVVPASFWLPIGYPEDLQRAEELLPNNFYAA